MNKLAYGIIATILTAILAVGTQFLLAYAVGYLSRAGAGGFNPASVYLFLLLNFPVLIASIFTSYKLSLIYVQRVNGTRMSVDSPLPLYLLSLVFGTVTIFLIAELIFDIIVA